MNKECIVYLKNGDIVVIPHYSDYTLSNDRGNEIVIVFKSRNFRDVNNITVTDFYIPESLIMYYKIATTKENYSTSLKDSFGNTMDCRGEK